MMPCNVRQWLVRATSRKSTSDLIDHHPADKKLTAAELGSAKETERGLKFISASRFRASRPSHRPRRMAALDCPARKAARKDGMMCRVAAIAYRVTRLKRSPEPPVERGTR